MRLPSWIWKSGTRGSLGLQGASQGLQILLQLLLVPVLVTAWGLETYGVWLILFTIPGYLTIADFGLNQVGANLMVQRLAADDRDAAIATFQALRTVVSLAITAVMIALGVVLLVAGTKLLAFADQATGGHARLTVIMLAAYGLLNLMLGSINAGFRAANDFVLSGYAILTLWLLENAAAMLAALAGHGILIVSATYLSVRAAGTIGLTIGIRRRENWLFPRRRVAALRQVEELFRPGMASLAITGGNVVIYQGVLLAISSGAGIAAVPVFTTMRLLSRLPLQLCMVLARAWAPVYTLSEAAGEGLRSTRIMAAVVLASLFVLVPGALICAFGGSEIVTFWTAGKIVPPLMLALVLGFAVLPGGLWLQLAELMMATNRHTQYGATYLALSLLTVVAVYFSSRAFGIGLGVLPLLLLELAMFAKLVALARRHGMLDWLRIAASVQDLLDRARNWLMGNRQ